jgi:hypothetical protein
MAEIPGCSRNGECNLRKTEKPDWSRISLHIYRRRYGVCMP